MPSSNEILTAADGWKNFPNTKVASNEGAYKIDYITHSERPVHLEAGHPLYPGKGTSAAELPDEPIWFKTRDKDALLVVSV